MTTMEEAAELKWVPIEDSWFIFHADDFADIGGWIELCEQTGCNPSTTSVLNLKVTHYEAEA